MLVDRRPLAARPPIAAASAAWRRSISAWVLAILFGALSGGAVAAEGPTLESARLGVGDRYKLGHWSVLRVNVAGGDEPLAVRVLASFVDGEGLGAGATTASGAPLSTEPGRVSEARVPIRVGSTFAPVEVRLVAEGKTVARRVWQVGGTPIALSSGQALTEPIPASDRLVLQAGATVGAADAVRESTPAGGEYGASVALVTDAATLPRTPLGYDSFDAVLLTTGSGWLANLTADDVRVRALVDWVRSGGRLVLSCGSASAELLGPGGALAELSPGRFDTVGSLTVTRSIETFAEVGPDVGPIRLGGGVLSVAELRDVSGVVEAYAGRSADETPLVVRTPVGFGEVTFVAVDLEAKPLAAWPGRTALVRQLLRLDKSDTSAGGAPVAWRSNGDAAARLVDVLDESFSGVTTPPFLLIVGLVLAYLVLIGPGDYYLVRRVLKRPELTWVTFPAIVAVTSVAAYAAANWLKGDQVRVNQVELIDIDTIEGRRRGVLVTHVFSPTATRYDLDQSVRTLDGRPQPTDRRWTAVFGKGEGARSLSLSRGVPVDYRLNRAGLRGVAASDDAAELLGVPVPVWSTRTFLSRHVGPVDRSIEAELVSTTGGLVEGAVTNDTGATLSDCRLLYGVWAWRLGTLRDGQTAAIDSGTKPIKLRTLLRQSQGNTTAPNQLYGIGMPGLADVLAVGGDADAEPEGAVPRVGLATHLAAGRAILLTQRGASVAPNEDVCSELLDRRGEPLVNTTEAGDRDADEPADRRAWVYARFLLPVQEPTR